MSMQNALLMPWRRHPLEWRTGIMLLCGLLALLLSQPSEAGMLKWLFGERVQVSPEIRGVLLESGAPKVGMVVKRYSSIQGRGKWEYSTTDKQGIFSFPVREARMRRGLNEVPIGVTLLAEHYPSHGEDTQILYFSGTWDMKSPETDLLMSDISCELTGDEQTDYFHRMDQPDEEIFYRRVSNRCTFAHAGRLIVPQSKLDEMDLRFHWESLYRIRDGLRRLAEADNTRPYYWEDLESRIKAGLGQIEDIREMETDPDKLATLPELATEFEAYWDLFTDKKEQ